MTEFLWDASDFDWDRGPMDLRAAAADGIVGFTHKFTEATWVKHKHSGEAVARARDAGMEFIGGYHVVRSTSPAEQVDYFLSYLDAVAPWWRSFPGFFLQVDLELWPYDAVTAATGLEFTRQLIAAQSKRVILYASRGQYGNQLTGSPAPLWNAAYGANPVAHYPDAYAARGDTDPLYHGWATYSGQSPAFLQYGSQLRIGTQPGCDANAFRGSINDLRALLGVAPAPEGDDMIAHLWRDTNHQQWYVTGPLQTKRAVSNAEADTIRYYASGPGLPGFTLVDLVGNPQGDADPAVIPGVDITHIGTGGSGPTHEQLVEAAFEGAQRAEDE